MEQQLEGYREQGDCGEQPWYAIGPACNAGERRYHEAWFANECPQPPNHAFHGCLLENQWQSPYRAQLGVRRVDWRRLLAPWVSQVFRWILWQTRLSTDPERHRCEDRGVRGGNMATEWVHRDKVVCHPRQLGQERGTEGQFWCLIKFSPRERWLYE